MPPRSGACVGLPSSSPAPPVRRPLLIPSVLARVRGALVAAIAGVQAAACAGGPRPAPASSPAADSAVARALGRERSGAVAQANAAAGTLAVLPFAVAPGDTALAPLAYALADLLTTDLARSPRLTLVERARLGEVLRELARTSTGRVDSATAPRTGRFLQARQLVVGSLGPGVGGRIDPAAGTGTLRLGVRLADVQSGTVADAVDATAPLVDVLAAEKALAFRIFEALGVVLTPAERELVERRPTANLAALLAYGRGVRDEYQGDYRDAMDEFRRASRIDPGFGAARSRLTEARTLGETGTLTPILVPGLRPVDAAVASTVDRLNRPLDPLSSLTRPGTAADPAFPITTTTVVIVVTRP